jgi:hypothetical protein
LVQRHAEVDYEEGDGDYMAEVMEAVFIDQHSRMPVMVGYETEEQQRIHRGFVHELQ